MKLWDKLELHLAVEQGYKKITELEIEIPVSYYKDKDTKEQWIITSYKLDKEDTTTEDNEDVLKFDNLDDVVQWFRNNID